MNKQVTIDADYFAELYNKAKERNEIENKLEDIIVERDELKAKLATSQNYEDVIAAKDREIAIVTEDRNRLNAKVNELIKGRDARQAERDKEREKVKELNQERGDHIPYNLRSPNRCPHWLFTEIAADFCGDDSKVYKARESSPYKQERLFDMLTDKQKARVK